MDKQQFIDKFFDLYADSFPPKSKQSWLDAYKKVLDDEIDYDKLENFLLLNWDKKTAPPPAWLRQNALRKESAEPQIVKESIVFENIWGTAPNGYRYCFGYNPKESNYSLEAEKLLKMNFSDISKEERVDAKITI